MPFIKYSKRKPTEEKEYLCRFLCDKFSAVRGCQYLEFKEGGFQAEHDDYYNLEWLDEESPSLPALDGWVDCNERLPETKGFYLTFDTNRIYTGDIEVYRFDIYTQSWFFGEDCYHPTHWQPLPKPPHP